MKHWSCPTSRSRISWRRTRPDGARGGSPAKESVRGAAVLGGLSLEETAEALDVSTETVTRDWRFAKLWLLRERSEE
jgi:ECF sigma factor